MVHCHIQHHTHTILAHRGHTKDTLAGFESGRIMQDERECAGLGGSHFESARADSPANPQPPPATHRREDRGKDIKQLLPQAGRNTYTHIYEHGHNNH